MACGQAAFQGNISGGVGLTRDSSSSHLHCKMESDAYGKVNPHNFVSL